MNTPLHAPQHAPGRAADDAAHAAEHPRALPTPEPGPVAYRMDGDFLEVCDCFAICPCWTGGRPDEDECTGIFAWAIREGEIGGVDVSGRTVVSLSTHEGHRDNARQRVLLFVDEDADDDQARALVGAFAGLFGGPLGDLGRLLGSLISASRATIALDAVGQRTRLSVDRAIESESVVSSGPDGRPTRLSGARLSTVLGDPAEVGEARRLRVGLPWHGIDIDLRGRSAMRGAFGYRHEPGE